MKEHSSVEKKGRIPRIDFVKRLEDKGIVSRDGDTLIADLDKLRRISIPTTADQAKRFGEAGLINVGFRTHSNTTERLFEALRDKKVVSAEDYESAKEKGEELVPRPLFYAPESLGAAMDPEKIKGDESYLGKWDISQKVRWGTDLELKNGEKIGLNELAITRKIFHDLDGQRDENGVLTIRDPETGERNRLNSEYMRHLGLDFSVLDEEGKTKHFWASPVAYLINQAPRLLEYGLLKVSDFESRGGYAAEMVRKRYRLGSGGKVSLGRAGYLLGSELDIRRDETINDRFSVVLLSPKLGGVIEKKQDGREVVKWTFHVKDDKEIEDKRNEVVQRYRKKGKELSGGDLTAHTLFGKKDGVELIPYFITGENKPFPGETHEQYAERIRTISDFNMISDISRRLGVEAKIGIHKELSLREQQWLATAVREVPGSLDRVIDESKKYSVPFLRTFLSAEYGVHYGKTILDIAEHAPESVSKKIFGKYCEIADATRHVEKYLRDTFQEDENYEEESIIKISEELLRRGKDILANYSGSLAKKDRKIEPQEVEKRLDWVNGDVLLLASTVKEFIKSGKLELKDLVHAKFETKDALDLSESEKQEMVKIFIENRKIDGYSKEMMDEGLEEFNEALSKFGKRFYLLYTEKGDVVTFIRYDELENGNLYAGSLNVYPEVRGSALGGALIRASLEKEAGKKPVEAVVNPGKPVNRLYIEEFGFSIVSVIPDYKSGGPYYSVLRDNALNDALVSKKLDDKEIVRISIKSVESDELYAKMYEFPAKKEEMVADVSRATSNGYVVSRFIQPDRSRPFVYLVFEKKPI